MKIPVKTCPICQDEARLMANHPDAKIFRCCRCTHAFSDPDSMPIQEAYDEAYFSRTHRRWFQHPNTSLFKQIADRIPLGSSVLDVGCGRGDLLRYLHSRRPDLQLTGVDFSRNSAEGIRFLQGNILSLDIPETFDFVISLAVIEHVSECVAFGMRLRELASPSGAVVVTTINESSILYGLARAGRALGIDLAFNRLYSRHHLHHFTRQSLHEVLESCGLKVSKQIMHNAPLSAMDLPVRNAAAEAMLRAGVWAVFMAGSITSKTYQQTAICSTSTTAS